MITYLLGLGVRSLFDLVIGAVRMLFGSAWSNLASNVHNFLMLDGVAAGLGFVDTFVGIDFMVWATGLAVSIVITTRLIRLVLGLFSRGA